MWKRGGAKVKDAKNKEPEPREEDASCRELRSLQLPGVYSDYMC